MPLSNTSFGKGVMKQTWVSPIIALAALTILPALAEANSGDFSGGVAIGTGYAGVDAAPTNGLIIQGNVGIGTTSPPEQLSIQTPTTNIGAIGWYDNNAHTMGKLYVTGGSPNAGGINFYNSSGTETVKLSGYNEASYINTGGYIGIGTTSPGYPLTVSNSGSLKLQLTGSSSQNGMGFDAAAGGDWFYLYSYASGFGIYDNTASAQRLTILNNGTIGVGTLSPRGGSTLDVNGKLYVGTFAASTTTTVCQSSNVLSTCTSARRFKEKIRPSELGLKEVLAMKPVTFDFKDHKDNWEKHDFGFVAEDMADVNPLFVTYDDKGEINGVRYMQLTAVNARAIQEMQAEIDDLKRTIKELKHQ